MTKKDLHNYQLTAIDHVLDNTHAGLILDMGLGKTVSTLTAIKLLIYDYLDISTVLVIAPKWVAENVWSEELQNWSHLKGLTLSIIAGTEKQRKEALLKKADIYTIGRDNTAWLCNLYGGGFLPFDMLVVDESSSFKNSKSLRFKALRKAQALFSRVVILTGTPAPNGLIDLWSQIYLLDQGQRLGKFITQYRKDYFTPGQTNGAVVYNYILNKGGEERIHAQIKDICISMKAEDYLDLPGCIHNDITVRLDDKTQEAYNEFEREQIMDLFTDKGETKEITALNAAALSNKLLQYANGAVYDENKEWHEVHKFKLEACKDLVESAQRRPVLIAWTFRHDMYRLKDYLKEYVPRELKTRQDIKDWNAGKIQVLLMHPASGGHGLNLQAGGSMIIWFGQTWSVELYQQLNARLARQGQKEIVIINKLIAKATLDQKVIRSRGRKEKGQEGLIKAIKARLAKVL